VECFTFEGVEPGDVNIMGLAKEEQNSQSDHQKTAQQHNQQMGNFVRRNNSLKIRI